IWLVIVAMTATAVAALTMPLWRARGPRARRGHYAAGAPAPPPPGARGPGRGAPPPEKNAPRPPPRRRAPPPPPPPPPARGGAPARRAVPAAGGVDPGDRGAADRRRALSRRRLSRAARPAVRVAPGRGAGRCTHRPHGRRAATPRRRTTRRSAGLAHAGDRA